MLIFGELGLTPYKLNLFLMPQLVVRNFIRSPWEHLCETLEKSNYHANKEFQSSTMRGGGRLHNHDPLFLEMFFLFCSFIKSGKRTSSFLNNAEDVLGGTNPIPSYLQICQKSLKFPKVAMGESVHLACCFPVCDLICWVLSDVQRQQLREIKQNRI